MQPRRPDRPLAIGHRGAAALAPGNTLRAIAAALAAGADVVEVDVLGLRDGTLILAHSDDLAELSHGAARGRIGQRRLAELRRVAPELVTLEEALGYLGERSPTTGVHLDLKRGGYEADLVRVLRRHRAVRRAFASSCSAASLRRLARLEPDLDLALTYPCDRLGLVGRAPLRPAASLGAAAARRLLPRRIGSLLRRARAGMACLHHSVVSPAVVRSCHAHGARVLAWTVNDPGTLSRVLRAGVDGVVMDDPRLLADTLAP
jgi:glycerophosphoryl diester phosphodiesterase